MEFWHDSGSSTRKRRVDPRRWSPENCVLACSRVFKRLFPNAAVPSVVMSPLYGAYDEGARREG
eukprot:6409183-Pyramimonas_sp.AAC.1